jgi:hypothetical protein
MPLGLTKRWIVSWPKRRRRVGTAGGAAADATFGVDRDLERVVRHRDLGQQHVAAAGDELAVGVEVEATVARVAGRTIGQRHGEEALAVDRHVEIAFGDLQRAGREHLGGAVEARARADLRADRHRGCRRRRGRDPATAA